MQVKVTTLGHVIEIICLTCNQRLSESIVTQQVSVCIVCCLWISDTCVTCITEYLVCTYAISIARNKHDSIVLPELGINGKVTIDGRIKLVEGTCRWYAVFVKVKHDV